VPLCAAEPVPVGFKLTKSFHCYTALENISLPVLHKFSPFTFFVPDLPLLKSLHLKYLFLLGVNKGVSLLFLNDVLDSLKILVQQISYVRYY
jgi:hypothetical protein